MRTIKPAIILAAMFLYAIAYNAISTLLTDVMTSTGMSLESMGFLLSSLQVGILIAIVISCAFLMKTAKTILLRVGMLAMSAALILIILIPGGNALYVLFALFGIGGFFTDTGANAYLSAHSDKESRKYIPMLHFIYSLGALSSGYLLMPFRGGAWRAGYGLIGILILIVFFLSMVTGKKEQIANTKEEKGAEPVSVKVMFKDPVYVLFTLSLMCYMVSQQINSNWYPYFIETTFNASNSVVAGAMLSFWLGIAAIRLLSGMLLSKGMSPVTLNAFGMLLSCGSQLIATTVGNEIVALVFICLSGFFAGAAIPSYVVEASARYRGNTFFISTFYTLLATVGRMIAQPLVAHAVESHGAALTLRCTSLLLFSGSLLSFIVLRLKKREDSKGKLC